MATSEDHDRLLEHYRILVERRREVVEPHATEQSFDSAELWMLIQRNVWAEACMEYCERLCIQLLADRDAVAASPGTDLTEEQCETRK